MDRDGNVIYYIHEKDNEKYEYYNQYTPFFIRDNAS